MAKPPDIAGVADKVEGNPVLQIGARVGYTVSGVLHLLIGLATYGVYSFVRAKYARM
jgi:hypothetical protein